MQIAQDIIDYIDLIDEQYSKYRGQISRVDPVWGTWSIKMNLEIRAKAENEDDPHPQPLILKMIMLYWIKKSQLLEMHFGASKHYGQSKRKRFAKDVRKIRDDILGNRPTEEDGLTTPAFQKMIMESM